MKLSIQNKFLIACIFLVLLTATSMSVVYYLITRESKHRETRKRVQIAFDIIFDDYNNRARMYQERFQEFLQTTGVLDSTAYLYAQDHAQISSKTFITANLGMLAEGLKEFGDVISANEIALYGADKRLLAIYQSRDQGEIMGVYAMTEGATPTFLLTNDTVTNRSLGSLLLDDKPVPKNPLPDSIVPVYVGEIPDAIEILPFARSRNLASALLPRSITRNRKPEYSLARCFIPRAWSNAMPPSAKMR